MLVMLNSFSLSPEKLKGGRRGRKGRKGYLGNDYGVKNKAPIT